MKIGIITHPLIYNYGGILQNYALQDILKEMGHEVYTIDRLPKTPIKTKFLSLGKRILLKLSGKNIKLRGWQSNEEFKIINKNTRGFVENNIILTEGITNNSEINKIHRKYKFDAYVVGSDQVWRRNEARGNNLEFLDFLEDNNEVKKIAYSASFGVSEWEFNEEETKKFKRLAQLFDPISVREDAAVQLCQDYLNVEAQHLVDPTMLLTKDKFISVVEAKNIKKSDGNLFSYVLDRNETKKKIIDNISEELGMKYFEVMPEQNFKIELEHGFDIHQCVFPEIEEWLRAFIDAKFVITDSFHGTAFAILFNKPFIAIVNKRRGASRFYSLLKTFGLENRAITEEDSIDFKLISEEIDFAKVNRILNQEREKSKNFLKEALND
ncbi:polysaccharide pyruvyl transferase family protein [Salegentibacter salegens]|uniref:Polysaccharide pyruvyl transferase n=1 Tax=Salegentibacter salegens TaxID=143223 RepID=A0A1M7IM11_9FLAO|nr:polysaccharide pyruvyl transferase family protein [Salegentibacter salegens]PRX42477.1 polysaccharide pyruvyl transferase [Salegentibacter salegens]SHM41770.1 Polysaccharide pyruvyl transferase [Salegentibacter salegens]